MARQRNLATRTNINKQGWEESEFPVACEKCYGSSPYMRMLKEKFGQECRICFRPFTVFKWKVDKARYKRTAICQNCAKTKNLCQTCLNDLQFGLPMQIRDKRCGQNGKKLLDANFESGYSIKHKPKPPTGPPPPLDSQKKDQQIVILPPSTIYQQSSESD